jgi:NifU-like protein involved in Fe-S cluster formation
VYSPELLDHFRNPRNAGDLEEPAIAVEVSNPACGDTLRLSVRWEKDRIDDIAYRARGCTASIAAGSALTDLLRGRTRSGAASLTATDIEAAVGGLPAESRHAAALCCDAVRAMLRASG